MLMCNPQREGEGFGEEVAAAFFAFDPLRYHGGGTRKLLFFGCLVGTSKSVIDFYFLRKIIMDI